MSDNNQNQIFPADADQQPEQRAPQQGAGEQERHEVIQQLQELGNQIETTIRTFVEKGPGKQIVRDVSRAFEDLGNQVQRAARSLNRPAGGEQVIENEEGAIAPVAPQQQQQAPSAPDLRAAATNVASEVESLLVNGLQQLNGQLRKLNERLDARYQGQPGQPGQQAQGSDDASQAATGPTQRLKIEQEDEGGNGQQS